MFRLFLQIILITASSRADDVKGNCNYYMLHGNYRCSFSAENSSNEEDIKTIEGTHLEGYGDDNVVRLQRADGDWETSIVPQILCQKFTNLRDFDLSFVGLETMTENSFANCLKLAEIYATNNKLTEITSRMFAANVKLHRLILFENQIERIEANSFENSSELSYLFLWGNQIAELDEDSFRGLSSLYELYLQNNLIAELPAKVFQDLTQLNVLSLQNNRLTRIHPEFLESLPSGPLEISLLSNVCISTSITFRKGAINEARPYFEECFDNFQASITTTEETTITEVSTTDSPFDLCSFYNDGTTVTFASFLL